MRLWKRLIRGITNTFRRRTRAGIAPISHSNDSNIIPQTAGTLTGPELYALIESDNVERFEDCIRQRVIDPNLDQLIIGENAFPLLNLAARLGSYNIVRCLIARGVEVNSFSTHFVGADQHRVKTPLHEACSSSSPNAVKITKALLAARAIAIQVGSSARTPLHEAAENSSEFAVELIDTLVAYGAKAYAADHNDETPLNKACQNVNAKNYSQRFANAERLVFHDAYLPRIIYGTGVSTFFLLVQAFGDAELREIGLTALRAIAKNNPSSYFKNDGTILGPFIACGVRIHLENSGHNNAFHYAAKNGLAINSGVVKELTAHSVRVKGSGLQNIDMLQALDVPENIVALLRAGAHVPAHYFHKIAVNQTNRAATRFIWYSIGPEIGLDGLIENDPAYKNDLRTTFYFWAIYTLGRLRIGNDDGDGVILLKILNFYWGDDPFFKQIIGRVFETIIRGTTLLHLATEGNRPNKIMELLAAAPKKVKAKDSHLRTPLHNAVSTCGPDIIKELIAAGAPVNAPDENGCTPLHSVCTTKPRNYRQRLLNARLLLLAGADLNFPNKWGVTPFLYMLSNFSDQELRKLGLAASTVDDGTILGPFIAAGANIYAKNIYRHTAVHFAAYSLRCVQNVIKELAAHGLELKAIDAQRQEPLDIANIQNTHYLVAAGAKVTDDNLHCIFRSNGERSGFKPNANKLNTLLAYHPNLGPRFRDIMKFPATNAKIQAFKATLYLWAIYTVCKLPFRQRDGDGKLVAGILRMFFGTNPFFEEIITKVLTSIQQNETLLQIASEVADSRTALAILEMDPSKVNVCHNTTKKTPLHHAARRFDASTVKRYLAKGADYTAQDKEGKTPRDFAPKHMNFPNLLFNAFRKTPNNTRNLEEATAEIRVDTLKRNLGCKPYN